MQLDMQLDMQLNAVGNAVGIFGLGELDASFSSRNDLFRKLGYNYVAAESIHKNVVAPGKWFNCGGLLANRNI